MKISNETKVGLLTIVALTLLILGFNFLKGHSVFQKGKMVYAVFDEVGTLEKSNEVKIKGKTIGKVYDEDFTDKNASGIIVTINITGDVNIPKNSIAVISSPLTGSSFINIVLGDTTKYLKNGDTVITKKNGGILGDLTSQVSPTLEKARTAIDSLTILLGTIARLFDPATKNNIQGVISHLLVSSASLDKLLDNETGLLAKTLSNLNDVTGNLKTNNDTINSILHNVNSTTQQLASLNLKQTLDSVQETVNQLKGVMYKINHNNGTLGLLMNDSKLYDNLRNTSLGLEILIDDLKAHPKRYVNISIFGKKDKGGYLTSPLPKDTTLSPGFK
ncbi:MAG TPA: MlaD family protein [Chitinophagaceae bacterium]|jgi:phospholipid/cholesterol/gamma-HCH transport system substrate-binding protein